MRCYLQVSESCRNLVDLFCADPAGVGSSWEQRHKHQIRGSAAILKCMQQEPHRLERLSKNGPRLTLCITCILCHFTPFIWLAEVSILLITSPFASGFSSFFNLLDSIAASKFDLEQPLPSLIRIFPKSEFSPKQKFQQQFHTLRIDRFNRSAFSS